MIKLMFEAWLIYEAYNNWKKSTKTLDSVTFTKHKFNFNFIDCYEGRESTYELWNHLEIWKIICSLQAYSHNWTKCRGELIVFRYLRVAPVVNVY